MQFRFESTAGIPTTGTGTGTGDTIMEIMATTITIGHTTEIIMVASMARNRSESYSCERISLNTLDNHHLNSSVLLVN